MLPDLAAILVAIGLSAYVVLGGADFGTGIWDLTAGKDMELRARIKRSMAPVWEANHVWLIFILVVLWTAFPRAFGSITSTLALPLFLAAIGIILRGGAFALRGEASSIIEQRSLGAVFALSSLLVPFFLGAAVGGVAGERVPEGNAAGDEITSWLNGLSLLVGALGVVDGRAHRGGLPGRGLTPGGGGGARRQVQDARAHLRGGCRGVRVGRPRGRAQRGAGALGRAHLRARARLRTAVRRGRPGHAVARVDRPVRGGPLGRRRGGRRDRRCLGRRRSSPTCCRPT